MDQSQTITAASALLTALFGLLVWVIKQVITDHKSERDSWMKFLETHAVDEQKLMTQLSESLHSLSTEVRSWTPSKESRRADTDR